MTPFTTPVTIDAGDVRLEGEWALPDDAAGAPLGVVLFAHGSGSSRHSPRNAFVAARLRQGGLATLLPDLLTANEDRVLARRFDISLLTARLDAALAWLRGHAPAATLPVALFGASTGAAAALRLAAQRPEAVAVVVARGGRADLAGEAVLARVRAPTLLLVGADDPQVVALNHAALACMNCEKRLVIIPGAGHLFEEPGALEAVALQAGRWFQRHLPAADGMASVRNTEG